MRMWPRPYQTGLLCPVKICLVETNCFLININVLWHHGETIGNFKPLQIRAKRKSRKTGWSWFRHSKWRRWCRTCDMAWEAWFGNSIAANPAAGWREENGKIPSPRHCFRFVPPLWGSPPIDWSKVCVVLRFEFGYLLFIWEKFSSLSSTRPGTPQPMALPRYSTFLRVFKARWSDVLKFREKNLCLANNNKGYIFFWQLKWQWVSY